MNENHSRVVSGVHNSLSGYYKAMVVDSQTKEVVADYGWQKNIILNWGMDLLALYACAEVTVYGIAGTGSRPNKVTSSTSTITQSGTMITLWPGDGLQDFSSSVTASSGEIYYSASLQAGDIIVYANASRSNVLAIDTAGGLTASVDTSYTIESGSNQTFTIWKTSQTGLQKEVKRTNTYLTGVGNCGSSDTTGSSGFPNIRTYRRTYDFSAETLDKLYSEFGVSPVVTANSTVFSRVIFPSPVTVSSSFQLRVVYDLEVEVTPTSQRVITASISGWPEDPTSNTHASESIQNFLLSSVNTNGVQSIYNALLEPGPDSPTGVATRRSPNNDNAAATRRGIFASSVSTSLAPFGSAINRGTGVVVAASTGNHNSPAYVTGSYRYVKENNFGLNSGNTTTASGIWCVGFGAQSSDASPWSTVAQAVCVLFHASQSKYNTQVVSMSFGYTWNRTLAGY